MTTFKVKLYAIGFLVLMGAYFYAGVSVIESMDNIQTIVKRESHKKTHKELKPYFQMLYTISGGNDLYKNHPVSGFSNKVPMHVAGFCKFSMEAGRFEITINRKYWDNMDELNRTFLLAHETFHCGCKIFVHDNRKMPDNCPASIFGDFLVEDSNCLKSHIHIYLDEIVKGCNRK